MKVFIKLIIFCIVFGGLMSAPQNAHAWGNSGYGWGRISFLVSPNNTHTIILHDASTGALITPDTIEVILSNPASGLLANYNCTSSCPATITLTDTTGSWNNTRVDHNTYITKAGYNTAVSPGGFFLEPGVTTPGGYNGTLHTQVDVFLTPTSSGPQIDGVTPPRYDYYSYVPPLSERITPVVGATSVLVNLFRYQYNPATNTYSSRTFGPFTGPFPQTISLGLGTPYPDNSDLQIANYFEDNLGNRSSTGTFNFGLDTTPPNLYCQMTQTGNTIFPSVNIWSTTWDNISGISSRELSVTSDGGASWNIVTTTTNIGDQWDRYNFPNPGTYTFRYRSRDNALQTDGTRGQWTPFVNCGTVTKIPFSASSLSLDYSIASSPMPDGLVGNPETFTTSFIAHQDATLTLRWLLLDDAGSVIYSNTRTAQRFLADNAVSFTDSYTPRITDNLEFHNICLEVTDTASGGIIDGKCFNSYYLTNLLIVGHVFIDSNNNGFWDIASEGVYNTPTNITLFSPSNAFPPQTISTQANGAYTFGNLSPGSVLVSAAIPSGYRATTPNPINVNLSLSVLENGVNFGIRPLNVGEVSTPLPNCTLAADTDPVYGTTAPGFPRTSVITATCTNTNLFFWSIIAPNPTFGTVTNVSTSNTTTYVAPLTVVGPQPVTIALDAFGPGGGPVRFTHTITVLPRSGPPWIQTKNGDVHSNTGINTPGGP